MSTVAEPVRTNDEQFRMGLRSPVSVLPQMLSTPLGRVALFEKGTGAPILLVHSFAAAGGTHEMAPLFETLSLTHRVIAMDWLGFGHSDRPQIPYRPEFYHAQLRWVVDHVLPHGADVIALSVAGESVVATAVREALRIRRLVLISPTGFGRFVAAPPLLTRVGQSLTRQPLIGRALYETVTSRVAIKTFVEQLFANPRAIPTEYLGQCYATCRQSGARFAPLAFVTGALAERESATNYLRLTAPTLLLFGARSRFSDPLAGQRLQLRNAAIEAVTIPGVGDMPHFEDADATIAAINRFLTTPSPESATPAGDSQPTMLRHKERQS